MDRKRSLTAYRSIDLMLWAAILVVFEGVILRASRSMLFADQAFTVSLAAAITCILMMRWGGWCALYAVLAGAEYALLGGGTLRQLMIYTAGNLLALAALPALKKAGKERVRLSTRLSLGLGAAVWGLMALGRGIVSMMTGAPAAEAVRFLTTDSLSLVFTLVVIWIVRRLDGIFEDQRHYLRRFRHEQEEERMEQA